MSNLKIDNNRLEQLMDNSGKSEKAHSSPSSRDVSEFEKNLARKEQDSDKGQEQNQNPFESIFKNSFFSENKVLETQPVLQNSEINFELTDKLIDRILVSDTQRASEVRIQLSDDLLKDTEITLKRLQDGSLEIKLNSSDYNSTQSLIGQQFELKSRLEKIENCNVTVKVNAENQEQGNDTHKKSRGIFDFYNQEEN